MADAARRRLHRQCLPTSQPVQLPLDRLADVQRGCGYNRAKVVAQFNRIAPPIE